MSLSRSFQLLLVLIGTTLSQQDGVNEGDQWPGSMYHNLHCDGTVFRSSSLDIEQFHSSPPEMHFYLDVQVYTQPLSLLQGGGKKKGTARYTS